MNTRAKLKIGSSALCCFLFVFSAPNPVHAQNLIKNGDFEEPLGPDNWTIVYTSVLNALVQNPPAMCGPEDFMVRDRTTMAHKDRIVGVWDGNYFGGHFRPNSDWLMHAYFKQTVTNLVPGSNYIVTAWMSQNALYEKVQVYLEAMGGPAGALSRKSPTIYTNVWKAYSVTNSASTSGEIEVRLHYNKNLTTAQWKWRNIDAFYDRVTVLAVTQAPPVIVTQPYATNVCPGGNVTFAVVAESGAPLTYQWFYNTYTRIPGATNATLTITNAQSVNAGRYSVDVSNGYEVTSSNVLLTVGTTIAQQPAGQNVCPGSNAVFTVTASGVGTLTYQWQTNGVDLGDNDHYAGATTASLTVTNAGPNDLVSYRCVVTSDCGSVTSSAAGLALSGTAITQQPSSAAVGDGCTVSFTVAATGCGAITYRWQKNNLNLDDGGHYSGVHTTTLTITGADDNDAADYRCAVSDAYVTTYSSDANLTVTTDCTPCGLTNGDFEGGNTGGVGGGWTGYQRAPNPTTVWSIQAASPPEGLQYQQIANTSSAGGAGVRQDIAGCIVGATYEISGWMRGNSLLLSTCTVKASPAASTNWATAVDLNPPQTYTGSSWTAFSGTVVATGATMTVWLDGQTGGSGENKAECFDAVTITCVAEAPPPDITQQPADALVCPGGTTTFNVAATGLGALTYQWQKNQDDLSDGGHYFGTATTTLIVTNTSEGDVGTYRCVVSYGASSTNSDEAALALRETTLIATEPASQVLCPGENLVLTVAATGDGALTYQWQTNGVNLTNNSHYSGCTTSTLTVTNITGSDVAGVDYLCLITGGCGSATSTPPAITLKAATTITQPPDPQNIWPGSNTVFNVTATGDGALTYQWQKNGAPVSNGGHYAGATTPTLTVTAADGGDVADYACVVTAGCGSVTSAPAALLLLSVTAFNYPVNRDLPDGGVTGISDTRTVTTSLQSLLELKVRLKITGTYNGDLFCYLTHASGYAVLLNRVGRRAADPFGYDDPGLDVIFDSEATNDVHVYRAVLAGNHHTPLGTNLMGDWMADGRTANPMTVLDSDARPAPLDVFTGMDPNGTWTLFVADLASGDTHALESWGLEMVGPEAPPTQVTIYGKVQLQGFTGSGPRTVRFVATDTNNVSLQTNDISLTFGGSPRTADYSLNVPLDTAYVSAKTAWNLRRRQAVTFESGVATNNFTGAANQLLGGDISQNNNLVNTADYTLLRGNWLKSTDSADLTGDGLVNTADYTILRANWLKTGDAP